MKIAATKWEAYTRSLARINEQAAKEMEAFIANHGTANRKQIIDYAMALITKYSEGSSELACEMYDAIAEIQGAKVKPAEPAAPAEYGEVAKAINGTLKQSPEGKLIGDSVGRLVKRAGADTMLQNAKRDRAEFAWIPSGDACPFCSMIASRGWQPATNETVRGNHADHIHTNCKCEFAIRFSKDMDVAGYEPEKLREEWDAAEGDTPREKINSWRRKLSEKNIETDVTKEYSRKAGPGRVVFDTWYQISAHSSEIHTAQWIADTFGGDIKCLKESNEIGIKMPDYEWNGMLWDLKTLSSEKAADSAIRHGLKQIQKKPGGFILDCNKELNQDEIRKVMENRIKRSAEKGTKIDVIIKNVKGEYRVFRYKK
ncbi:hypothetical protein SAMN02745687_00924 [Lachnospiraceae bacterium NK3A20]|nr:hypothetical protein SAMN02745687_00924 [Lachnospiraceae bacterium NK3A20]